MEEDKSKRSKPQPGHLYVTRVVRDDLESWSIKDARGNVLSSGLTMPREMIAWLKGLFQAYGRNVGSPPPAEMSLGEIAEKAGRPLPTDAEMADLVSKALRQAGVPPQLLYASEKTGLLVTENNQHMFSATDLVEWHAAIEEYWAKAAPARPPEALNPDGAYPDIVGNRATFRSEVINPDLLCRLTTIVALNTGWLHGSSSFKENQWSALGNLARIFSELSQANAGDPAGEAELWHEAAELALNRIGTLVADARLRLVYREPDGNAESEEEFSPEQWQFVADEPDPSWYEGDQ